MKRFILSLFILLLTGHGYSQSKTDSLNNFLKQSLPDTQKVNVLNQLAWEYKSSLPDKSRSYALQANALANKLDYEKGFTFSIYILGWIYDYKGDYEKAIIYYDSALANYLKSNNKKGVSSVYNNLGNIYSFKGDYDKAVQFLHKSLTLKEQLKDSTGIAKTLNNIGIIYENKENYVKALEYYTKSLQIKEYLHDADGKATSYSNIGGIQVILKRTNEAISNYNKAVSIYQRTKNNNGLALTYNSLGSLYMTLKDYDLAIKYQKEALLIHSNSSDKLGVIYSLDGLAEIYTAKGAYDMAIKAARDALAQSREIGAIKEQMDSYKILAFALERKHNYQEALDAHRNYVALKDSLNKDKSNRLIEEMQTKYETVQKEKKIGELNKEKAIKSKEAAQERLRKNFFVGLALFSIALVLVVLYAYRSKQRSNALLSHQRDLLKEKNKLIEEKNKEIADSIAYAKYIQDAILPSLRINELLKDSFLIFLPKDIVSGDFYWFERDEEHIYIAVADCTGHGIPGAFMSMIGTMLLNEIYNEKKVRTPGGMLTSLNHLLQMSLKQTENPEMNIRNGMDIIIVKLNTSSGVLEVASANRPLYYIRQGNNKVETLVIDKTAIGGLTDYNHSFKTEIVNLDRGDSFYLSSDGYADQFGGSEGKKLMTRQLKNHLLEINELSMTTQHERLIQIFDSWKGKHEQVDDVLVIGGRV